MGEVIEFPLNKSVKADNEKSRTMARSYRQWRRVNEKKYKKFRQDLLDTIDSDDNVGTVMVTLDDEGRTTVQCDISEPAAVAQLYVAIALLSKDTA